MTEIWWTVYRITTPQRENSTVDCIRAETAEQAFDRMLEEPNHILGSGEYLNDDLFLVCRSEQTPGRNGQESVTHDHRLFRLNYAPTAVLVEA